MKKIFLVILSICMILFSNVSVYAMVYQDSHVHDNIDIAPRTVFSEYKWLGAQNGAGAEVQILKNDVGSRIYIMGVNMVSANGDVGVPKDSIYITHTIHDNGAFANITVHYKHWGTPKTKVHTVYAY